MKRIPAILMTVVMLLCAAAGAFADTGADIKVGEYITFGRYPQTSAGTDETPIEWLVLDVQDGKALLLSRYGLDAKPYNTSLVDVTWETCSLRAWLNSDFLNAAFNAEEQNAIQVTEVDNSKAQGCDEWSTDGGNNTQDKLFLLSYGESNRYFGTNRSDTDVVAARIKPTDFAIAQGAETRDAFMTEYNTPAGGWMLRSPALKQSNVACVYIAGKVSYYDVTTANGCVRPALWVDLKTAFAGNETKPATVNDGETFTFRNGITWGMSKQEIVALEGESDRDRVMKSGYPAIYYDNVKVSKYDNALLGYAFAKESGGMIFSWYSMQGDTEEMLNYFKAAFDLKYGEEKEADASELLRIDIELFSTDAFKEDALQQSPIYRWDGPAGTQIWLCRYENNHIYIYYVSPELLNGPQEEEVDLFGL